MDKLAYNVEEAAQAIGCGTTKLYQTIKSGDLKARKLGKRTFILKEDLGAFLSNLRSMHSDSHSSADQPNDGGAAR